MAHARLCKQLKSRAESQSCSECAMSLCYRYCGMSSAPPRYHRCGKEDAQGVYFGFVHGISMAQASLGVCPPAFSLARICIISPTPLPDTACFQHGLTLQALLSIQPSQDQGLPKTFGPAGFQFLILPLWASSFLLPALALMPMSCLPPAGACSGGCELGTGPTAVVLNLLCSKRRLSKDLLPTWRELWAHP